MAKAPATPMTKTQLITLLSDKAELPKAKITEILGLLAETAYKEAKKGFTIPGIGKLVVMDRKARMGRNPATGEAIKIKAKKVLKFRIAKAAKDAVTPPKKQMVEVVIN